MSKNRQQRHSEEVRGTILEIAQRILLEEGVAALSIRRVAQEMDYSAPIIYHYFKDKTELLSYAVQEGYRKLVFSAKLPDPALPPDEQLRLSFHYFVEEAMRIPRAYKAFILNYSTSLLAESSVLGDSGEQSPTLAWLIHVMEVGIDQGVFKPCDVVLTAKVWWSATFGLFFRFIVEPDITEEERNALIDRQADIMIKGISA